ARGAGVVLAADYLIVTHKDFIAAAKQLSRFHRARGLRTRIVTTELAYDLFGHGRPSPRAIRNIIREAGPAYVLLLGGATVDSNDYLGEGNTDFVPAPFVKTSGFGYEAAADGWFAPVGVAVGRLAVRSSAEATTVVEKITSWHGSHQPAGSALFVADRDEAIQECFEDMADSLIGTCVPGSLHPERLFVRSSQDPGGDFSALVGQGMDVVTFMGHAFLTGWSNPPMVTTESAGRFTNEHLFLLLSFSCFDGAFTGPWGESLSWALVSNPDGGALAAVAASSLTNPSAVELLSEQILCQLTSGEAATFGEALAKAERMLSGLSPALDDVISTFNLLGDPATPNPWAE
ncbi:C25 family cysteine peptidase, partial [Myxococcota bacterium]